MNRRNLFKAAIASVVGLVAGGTAKAEERWQECWHPPTTDEDIWIPMRPSNERRIFHVDVPPGKSDEFMKRLKEQLNKKKRQY